MGRVVEQADRDQVALHPLAATRRRAAEIDRKSTRLNSSHGYISYAVFCLKKKKTILISQLPNQVYLSYHVAYDNYHFVDFTDQYLRQWPSLDILASYMPYSLPYLHSVKVV